MLLLVNNNRGTLPSFSQVFILEIVKVLCFDTVLEVFILNGLRVPPKAKKASKDAGAALTSHKIT